MTILSSWRSQYAVRSGTRAIVPSSFMISQTTPAGFSPASRARSTAASVWPERSSTPPGRARSGKTWPGRTRSREPFARVDRDLDRARAILRGDPGRDALARLDRDGEGGTERRLVVIRHRPQVELVAALRSQAEADQPAPVRRHEVDRLGSDELRGDRQVALVLAIRVVDDDDEAPRADVLDRLLDRRERRRRLGRAQVGSHGRIVALSARRAARRTSRGRRPRGSPAGRARAARASSRRVCAGSPPPRTRPRANAATVSDTPSTVTEPFSTQ